ncbi:hypothetical protein ACIBAG_42350 [Streptomyces sp. NPDC051243]|uniref:hypothetical protein n=1 Tax=Streptomyces sp. NPDC051243 TaxID=3365646 RepID=UPI003797E795
MTKRRQSSHRTSREARRKLRCVPEKKDHAAARLRRGSGGGRPEQFRFVATRYAERGYVFLGTVTVTVTAAALLLWLRS